MRVSVLCTVCYTHVWVWTYPLVLAWGWVYSTQRRQPLPGQECSAVDIIILGNTFFQEKHPFRVLLEPTFSAPASLPQDHRDPGQGAEWG